MFDWWTISLQILSVKIFSPLLFSNAQPSPSMLKIPLISPFKLFSQLVTAFKEWSGKDFPPTTIILIGTNVSFYLEQIFLVICQFRWIHFSRTQLFSNYIILKTSKKLFKRKRLFKKKIVENLTMLTFFIECWCIVPRNFMYFRHMNGSESLWLRSRKLDSILKGVTCSAFLSIVCSRSRWWLWDNWEWPGQHSQFLRCLIIPN